MAYTVSTIVNTVMGDKRLGVFDIHPDGITGVVTIPGAVAVDAIMSFDIKNAASLTCVTVAPNVNASGVAAMGVVGFSNVVSTTGSKYILTVLFH